MPTATLDTTDTLGRLLTEVTGNVITTMLSWPAPRELADRVNGSPDAFDIGAITGSIGFGGELTGTLFFSVNTQQASEMAEAVLGQAVGPDDRECLDVIGELTNMIAGGIKTRLNNQGLMMVMTIPSIIRGPSIRVAGKNVEFKIERDLLVGTSPEPVRVIMIGKVEKE